ncbi:MAG: hypothetical protein RBU30_17275 [Polyangia bacterium]|jgi:hypothetical protein|nr:hypothetical protein [Polyangia bacterium]
MASLEPVAAGFVVIPTKDRERRYVAFHRARKESSIPIDDALFELRISPEGKDVVLLPLRSFEAAKRIRKAFEEGAKAHERAERSRGGFKPV